MTIIDIRIKYDQSSSSHIILTKRLSSGKLAVMSTVFLVVLKIICAHTRIFPVLQQSCYGVI